METTTNPFAALIKSKRFWTMILTAAISFLVSVVPALETVRNELLTVFLVIGSVVVGGYSLEDAAIAYGEAQVKSAVVQSALSGGVSSQTAQAAREAYQTINAQSAEQYDRTRDR